MNCQTCSVPVESGATACSICGSLLDSQDAAPGHHLTPGTPLHGGDFTIGGTLGAGGFGITYQAQDHRLQRTVAIKEFFPPYCARRNGAVQPGSHLRPQQYEEARAGFLQEATTLARFRHPGIVAVFTVFEENNTAYMVMEFLQGRNLLQLLQEHGGRLAENDAVEIIRHVAASLSEVHEAGLLHRDIKPDNILLTGKDRVVLIDFGTAREFDIEHTGNQSRVVTPGYAPLEQYAPRARRGPFTDIYALAATLYHLVTGQPPAPATERVAGVELVRPRLLNAALSHSLESALVAGLAVQINQRPRSVVDFLSLLELRAASSDGTGRTMTDGSLASGPVEPAEDSVARVKTHRPSALSRKASRSELSRTRRYFPVAAAVLVLLAMVGIYQGLRVLHAPQVRAMDASPPPPLTQYMLAPSDRRMVAHDEITLPLPHHDGASFSPDGGTLASDDNGRGAIVLRSTTKPTSKTLLKGDSKGLILWSSVFSADGLRLATVRRKFQPPVAPSLIDVWDVTNGMKILSLPTQESLAATVLFSPDGKFLAVGHRDKEKLSDRIVVHALPSGKAIFTADAAVAPQSLDLAMARPETTWFDYTGAIMGAAEAVRPPALAFTPDSKNLLYGDGHGTVTFRGLDTGSVARQMPGFKDSVEAVAISPDGKFMAVATTVWPIQPFPWDRTVTAVDLSSGNKLWRTRGTGPFAFSTDGRKLAGLDEHARVVQVWPIEGEDLIGAFYQRAPHHECELTTLSFTSKPEAVRATGPRGDLCTWLLE